MSTENTVTSQPVLDEIITPKSYYSWVPDGKPVQVWLDFDVIDRMSAEVMRGFGSVPKRGAEVGGVLLGEVDKANKLSIHVHDFVMVPCDYRRGPSYQLTSSDTQHFSEAVAKATQGTARDLRPVGYFRSHTRDGMGLTEDDRQLFSNFFPDPTSVILLVRPFATKVSQAGFFFEENGQIRSDATYLTFPFRRRELGGGSIGEHRRQGAETSHRDLESTAADSPLSEFGANGSPVAAAAEAFAPAGNTIENRRLFGNVEESAAGFDSSFSGSSLTGSSSAAPGFATPGFATPSFASNEASQKIKKSWVWLPLSSIFLMLGVLVGFLIAITIKQPNSAVPLSAYGLSLAVQQETDSVHVTWDRGAVPVAIATRGILHIQDGDFYKAVELKAADLQTGSVIIRNVGSNVTLRLEVFLLDRNSLSEVRVVKNVSAPSR